MGARWRIGFDFGDVRYGSDGAQMSCTGTIVECLFEPHGATGMKAPNILAPLRIHVVSLEVSLASEKIISQQDAIYR